MQRRRKVRLWKWRSRGLWQGGRVVHVVRFARVQPDAQGTGRAMKGISPRLLCSLLASGRGEGAQKRRRRQKRIEAGNVRQSTLSLLSPPSPFVSLRLSLFSAALQCSGKGRATLGKRSPLATKRGDVEEGDGGHVCCHSAPFPAFSPSHLSLCLCRRRLGCTGMIF